MSQCGFRQLTLPEGLTFLGMHSFSENTDCSEYNLPSTVEYIGDFAFSKTKTDLPIVIPEGITAIGKAAFASSIQSSFTLPSTLVSIGSMSACREKGLIRSEGKDYVMKDGDVTLFRFNV